jgi:two-component system, NarL family, response regulator
MTDTPIRVLIVEDHLIARVGLSTIVDAQPDMTVVGEAANGTDAVSAHERLHPDVTLMDVRMPGTDGVEAIAAIRRRAPEARVVALSTYSGAEDIHRAMQAGAQAYLTKDVLDTELVKTIRRVFEGGMYLPPQAAAALAHREAQPNLTAREIEVLTLIVRGMGNKQVAAELKIAEYTVKNHVKNILSKLGVGDRTQAATMALRQGIVREN